MKRFILASAAAAALLAVAPDASANGRFPESNQLIFSKSDPNLVLLRVTFGVLISHDRGGTFDWVCEGSVGYSGVEDPMYAIGPSGRIIATTFQGITGTDDQGCNWKFQDPSMNDIFVDLTQNPNDAKNVVAFASGYRTSDDAGNNVFDSQLWETKDEGKTFVKLGVPLQERLLGYTVDVTKTDPKRIYVTAVRDPGKTGVALLLTSKDYGSTWMEQQIPLVGTERSIWIAGIDPNDAEKVYLRTSNNPDAPGRLILRDKDPSNPDLGTLKTLFTGKVPLDGFAISPDNEKVWVGSPVDGVWMASTADYKFERKSETGVKCLAAADDGLWACSNEAAKPIGFIAGVSTDDGATWTSKAHFCSIRGPLSCSAGSTTTEQCDWPIQRQLLGCDPDSTDGGVEPDGQSGSDAGPNNGATTTTTTSNCDCQSVLPTNGWSSAGGAAASALAAVIALLRRRRRRA